MIYNVVFRFSTTDKMADLKSAILETQLTELCDEPAKINLTPNPHGTEVECRIEFASLSDQLHWLLANNVEALSDCHWLLVN